MRYIALALFLVGCGSVDSGTTTWNVWLNHGHDGACAGSLERSDGVGSWSCGHYSGDALFMEGGGNTVTLTLAGGIVVDATKRSYDGALIGTSRDGRPFVAYLAH